MCDLCGNFVQSENDAKRERVLASESTAVSNTVTTMTLKLDLGKPNVCDRCFAIGVKKLKIWIETHI